VIGAPQGDRPDVPWEACDPFGITLGGVDLANLYKARYLDFNNSVQVDIPPGVNALKVFCIGGGGGGSGANGGTHTWNRVEGRVKWHPIYSGNNGAFGEYGEYKQERFAREANTFSIQIGNGGAGGNGGKFILEVWAGQGGPGRSGAHGNATEFKIGEKSLFAKGGRGGVATSQYVAPNSLNKYFNTPDKSPPYTFRSGDAGKSTLERLVDGGKGGDGNKGFCRVYFLY
jgi:hypothetical protein